MSKKYVYLFSEGNATMRELLGGKGANLAEMTNIGLPVPQGFTITTEACTQYYKDDHQINADIEAEIMQYVEKLEEMTGKKIIMKQKVDAALLGGFTVQIGDQLIDGSVARQLQTLKARIMQKD